VRLHGAVLAGLPFASPAQVWPLLQAAVDTSSADFVTSDPLGRPPAGAPQQLLQAAAGEERLPLGVTWSAYIKRYGTRRKTRTTL
jgi:hypothetical protein